MECGSLYISIVCYTNILTLSNFFCLFDLLIIEKGVLRTFSTAIDFSIYACNSISACLIYSDSIDLGKYECIPGELNLLSLFSDLLSMPKIKIHLRICLEFFHLFAFNLSMNLFFIF